MKRKTWRDYAKPAIAEVIQKVGRSDMKALRKAIREAYPFGAREYYPYKVWCDEVRVQLGLKPTKTFSKLTGRKLFIDLRQQALL